MLNKEFLDNIKRDFTISEVFSLMEHLGCEPEQKNDYTLIGCTCCHNGAHNGSRKLYYYEEENLFKCYTGCNDAFDIYDLVKKIKTIDEGIEWDYIKAAHYVLSFFGRATPEQKKFGDPLETIADWKVLKKYKESNIKKDNKIMEFCEFDSAFLNNFPKPIIQPWVDEGISIDIMRQRGICYNPVSQGVIIPHYDEYGTLIGVRERTLIAEEEQYGKYKPAIINGKMYNHALGISLYNLNFSKNNIQSMRKVIVFEAEKSTLKMASFFGADNDISVAVCGSNLIRHQVEILLKYNVNEIIIAFDREYKEYGDEEFQAYTKKLEGIHQKYSNICKISFMLDTENRLDYKSSPIDHGKDIFLKLFEERISL